MKKRYKSDDVWFVSDIHAFHTNIIKFCKRPYKDLNEMHEDIIAKWNKKVRPENTVFMLGDMIWSASPSKCRRFYSRLNGKKVLIFGNHDSETKQDYDMFEWVDRMVEIEIEDTEENKITNVTLCHYPMLSWSLSYRGGMQLFGHVHGRLDKSVQKWSQVDVSWDVKLDMFSWEDIEETATQQLLEFKAI